MSAHIFESFVLVARSAASSFEQWWSLPYWLLIAPLEWLMGQIFYCAYGLTGSPGLSILLLSTTVNILLLMLYYLGEKFQCQEQFAQLRMQVKLDEFKRAFDGSMLHMVRKTLYRQNGYHPIYALRSSIGFAIQVPFFIAAYRFLGGLELLQSQAWGPISDLARPDALLGLPAWLSSYNNLLPCLMTLLNLLSSQAYIAQAVYISAGAKKQFWGIALLFLLLLYQSPSGLLLYWSFGNLFSLVKNLILVTRKQGLRYWVQVGRSCQRSTGRIFIFLCGLPYLQVLEYTLAVFGLFLFARFKILDSVDLQAQQMLRWGRICWYSFAALQVLQSLVPLLKGTLPRAAEARKPLCFFIWPLFLHSLLIAMAFIIVRIPAVISELRTVELYLLPPVILALSLLFAIWPRLWRSRPYRCLAGLRQQQAYMQLALLAAGSLAALLGLALFDSSSLLLSSPSESPVAISVLLKQMLPSFVAALIFCLAFALLPVLLRSVWRKKDSTGTLLRLPHRLLFAAYSKCLLLLAYFATAALFLALANHFLLQYDYGVMTSWVFDQPEKLVIPFSTMLLVLGCMPLLFRLWLAMLQRLQILLPLCWILAGSFWASSAYYSYSLSQFSSKQATSTSEDRPSNTNFATVYSFSRSQPNVLIVMLDRFIGPYTEEILQLDPDLHNSLSGFTWYKNTTSFGPFTISGLTALLGGHEYSPEAMLELAGNLQDKVNQAYLMMPTLFQQNGFQVTVTDPSWANFDWKGDLELFRQQGIRAERLKGRYTGHWLQGQKERSLSPRIIAADYDAATAAKMGRVAEPNYAGIMLLLALFRALPSPLAPLIYDDGSWLNHNFSNENLFLDLVNTWSTLVALPQISDAGASQAQFILMTNDTPHEPLAMGWAGEQRYPFQPMLETERPSPENSPLPVQLFQQLMGSSSSDYSLRHFYANWATLRELQHYFHWMKQNGVYDNSLIILASDHGRDVRLPNVDLGEKEGDFAYFMPLLMVKMPNDKGVVQVNLASHSNADVPAFASQVLPQEQRRNPFTGKMLQFQDTQEARFAYYISQNPNSQKIDGFDVQGNYRIDGPVWQKESWQELP